MHGLFVQSMVFFISSRCSNTSVQVKALLVIFIHKGYFDDTKQSRAIPEFHFKAGGFAEKPFR